jgi:hypothetical protein
LNKRIAALKARMSVTHLFLVLLLAGAVAARSLHYRQPGRGANSSTVHAGQKFSFRKEGGAVAFINQLQPGKLQRIKNRSRFTGTTAKLAALLDRDPDLVSGAGGGLMLLQELAGKPLNGYWLHQQWAGRQAGATVQVNQLFGSHALLHMMVWRAAVKQYSSTAVQQCHICSSGAAAAAVAYTHVTMLEGHQLAHCSNNKPPPSADQQAAGNVVAPLCHWSPRHNRYGIPQHLHSIFNQQLLSLYSLGSAMQLLSTVMSCALCPILQTPPPPFLLVLSLYNRNNCREWTLQMMPWSSAAPL